MRPGRRNHRARSELRENPRAKWRRRLRARRRCRRSPHLSALSRFGPRRWLGSKTSASRRGSKSGSARRLTAPRRCELLKRLASFGSRIFKFSRRGTRKEKPRRFYGAATHARRIATRLGLIGGEARGFV